MDSILAQQHSSFQQRLAALATPEVVATLPDIRHGIEREGLRINPEGGLSQTRHPQALGSALKHELITTDFSEALMEFITPAETDARKTLGQLRDIHKFVMSELGTERLWPMSMPCFIRSEDEIPVAEYGESNTAKMKRLYRVGLKNRYGSMMQAIAGVHFNFSLPESFWQQWLPVAEQQQADKDNISAAYFAMIRNYRRFVWVIPYLYGASPALCSSFLQGKQSALPFKKTGKGTLYLPYATSLRMSDLGYTNNAQSGLNICYNQIDNYIRSLRAAINTPSETYQKFSGLRDGEYQQLNANVLQIENELYSPIRPKQPAAHLEKPTDALAARGVSYIEVRALDVNPFSDVGISLQQFRFLDIFLLYCLTAPSDDMDMDAFKRTEENLQAVVTRGREPGLMLSCGGKLKPMKEAAEALFTQMQDIAQLLDKANGTDEYSLALAAEKQKFEHPELTPSAKILDTLLNREIDNGVWGLELAEQYKQQLLEHQYQYYSEQDFKAFAQKSIEGQRQLEAEESGSLEVFLQDYFSTPKVCA